MIKVIVIEDFTLGKFDELKNIERANPEKNAYGRLYINDKFECTEEMQKYLAGENGQKKAFVKLIEVFPEVTAGFLQVKEIDAKEKPKAKRNTRKRKQVEK